MYAFIAISNNLFGSMSLMCPSRLLAGIGGMLPSARVKYAVGVVEVIV
jgi:hypothetical protein